jgi:integrase
MAAKIPYLFERGDTLLFRRRIPPRLQPLAGTSEWKLSLGKSGVDSARVLIEVRALTEVTDLAVGKMERGLAPSASLLRDALDTLYPARSAPVAPTVSEAAKLYCSAKRLDCLNKAEAMAVKQFVAHSGDIRLAKITRAQVREWISSLRNQARQSDPTIRRRLGSMSTIYAHSMEDAAAAGQNPFCRHRLSMRAAGQRLPFDREQLALIDAWLRGPVGHRPTGLIIRLLRATGARPLEIGGIDVCDLRLGALVPHLLIRPNSQRGLKTVSSQRMVPLVGDGLEAARNLTEREKDGAAFPRTCWATGSLSARLNKALRSCGIPKAKSLTAYSFRHTMAEALRTSDAPFDVQQALLGHARVSMTERYGARTVSLGRMRASLERALDDSGGLG